MNVIYKYTTVTIRWDVQKELSVRQDLISCTPRMFYVVGDRRIYLDCAMEGDNHTKEDVMVFGAVVKATIENPLPVGTYDMFLDFTDGEGAVKMQMQAFRAFAVTNILEESDTKDGANAVVKLRTGVNVNTSYSPTPMAAIQSSGNLFLNIDTDGDSFMSWGESKTITCRVFNALQQEVTDEIIEWSITRESEDSMSDTSWGNKERVKSFAGVITLYFGKYVSGESSGTYDLINDLGSGNSAKFTISAKKDKNNKVTAIIEI